MRSLVKDIFLCAALIIAPDLVDVNERALSLAEDQVLKRGNRQQSWFIVHHASSTRSAQKRSGFFEPGMGLLTFGKEGWQERESVANTQTECLNIAEAGGCGKGIERWENQVSCFFTNSAHLRVLGRIWLVLFLWHNAQGFQ